ncbi:MAG: FtsX-like permease family protein [bacterium]
MTFFRLSFRSAVFYRRAHGMVLAGAMLAGAVLVGAMLVGDSVKFSLMNSALLRLGRIQCALESRGRFFEEDLAIRLEQETGTQVVPALLLRGIALNQKKTGDEPRQINAIQIVGIDDRFWRFAIDQGPTLADDGVAINEKLAAELQVKRGDLLSIRFSKPSLMSKDAPLSSRGGEDTLRGTFSVTDIIPDARLGRFSLAANQRIPNTAFVSLKWLQQAAGLTQQANVLLAGGGTSQSAESLNQAIRKVWRIEDVGLAIKTLEGGRLFQLESNRIFMDPAIGAVVSDFEKSVGALTYLVNSISRVDGTPVRETPYSFVIALAPSSDPALGAVPPEMADDEIIVNRWLADCLAAGCGDSIRLSYFEFTPWNSFVEKSRTFKIRRIIEMGDMTGERERGPHFPGLTDAGKCAEWDIGMPLLKDKVGDPANEAYWNDYRATPKAMVTLKAGQAMWANHFGNLTAIRFRANEDGAEGITEALRPRMDPADFGLAFLPTRETALKAAGEAMDFGQLFLGMSLFLIVASLMLTGLLFAFGIQQRSQETGLLLAVGYRTHQVRRLFIHESTLIAVAGSLAGAWLGTLYTRAMIWGLQHGWQGAVAHAEIRYHASWMTIGTGILLSFVFAWGTLILTIRRQTGKSAHELLSGEEASATTQQVSPLSWRGLGWIPRFAWIAGIMAALGLIAYATVNGMQNIAPVFFASGSLLLISFLGLGRELLIHLGRNCGPLTILTLGFRNAGRRRSRSLTVTALLACGCFLILAVSSMQEDIAGGASRRDSGTGGFALFGESTLPIQENLNSAEGRRKFRLDQIPELNSVRIVCMKVRDGDDASCLNLNRAQTPPLIGVDPNEFEKRGAFQPIDERVWAPLMAASVHGDTVPGLVGDSNTAQWGLQKKVGQEQGDTLTFRDEWGGTFKVKLLGTLPMRLSVFQGAILIPASSFSAHYPSENGYRMFLIDTPPGDERRIQDALSLKLGKWGVNLTSTVERLKTFYEVESTYMAMFLVLGGLGMLLGSAGMAVVVLRNIQERRDELALLTAIGYSDQQVRRIVVAEHGVLLSLGLAAGITASLAAIWPSLQAPGITPHWLSMILFIGGLALLQLLWILFATRVALSSSLLPSLRNQ